MGSSTLVDYALFQLTPTRTRCDLLLFYGGKTEKLASGLFDPFVSHLKFAKDRISRGGYSIKLCPPTSYAPWFTKTTFERFVRFVSTPAVLERFVSLEQEILQIESSTQANGLSNTDTTGQSEEGSGFTSNSHTGKSRDSSKVNGDVETSNEASPEENSKVQLQQLLETRKTLLRKEQAMAYARGLVAGFEPDYIDDLISFADAFGASRLREACINFKELCKKKRGDGLWMEELAAMEACPPSELSFLGTSAMEACPPSELSFLGTSGIVLNNDASILNPNITLNLHRAGSTSDHVSNGSDSTTSNGSSDHKKDDNLATANQVPQQNTKMQVPMSWPHQMPPYMYNFQNPMQHMPPYQGYAFPIPPHYAMNMQWSPGLKESGLTRKDRSTNRKVSENSGEDEESETTECEEESDTDSYRQQDKRHPPKDSSSGKKHRKKSSKTVVIRNINYITPTRRSGEKNGISDESSEEEYFIGEDSIRQQVDDAVGSLEKAHKSKSSNYKKKCSRKSNGSNDATAQEDPTQGRKINDNWDAFQNLLMRDAESDANRLEQVNPIDPREEHYTVRGLGDETALATFPSLDLESEKVTKQTAASDSFVLIPRNGASEERNRLEDVENAGNPRSLVRRSDCTDGDLVMPRRVEELGSEVNCILATESTRIKLVKGEDWFVISHSGQPENQNSTSEDIMLSGGSSVFEKSRKDLISDDSFMVHARPAVDDLYDSQWKTDISMDVDLTSKTDYSTVKDSSEILGAHEPDDLYVVLERDSAFGSARESWTMDHRIDISSMETDTRSSNIETNVDAEKKLMSKCDSITVKKDETKGRRILSRDAKSKFSPVNPQQKKTVVSKTKPFVASRPLVQKSKLEKEEETRKKIEELLIQRQKRIAERTAASGISPAATKKVLSESKQVKGLIKSDKTKTHSMLNGRAR